VLLERFPMTPSSPDAPLCRFVARARAFSALHIVRWTVLDIALLVVACSCVAAAAAAWSLRGDLALRGLQVSWIVAASAVVLMAVRRARRAFGTATRTARTIARTPGPLRRGPCSPQTRRADELLRQEILGAFELSEAPPQQAQSATLAARYVEDVAARLTRPIDPTRALPRARSWPRLVLAAACLTMAFSIATWGPLANGLTLLLTATDGRPETPPEPVWSSLNLVLAYPEHTQRPDREVPNPSGALRVPAGTAVQLRMTTRHAAKAARVVLAYDPTELSAAPTPEVIQLQADDDTQLHWSGRFVVRGTGSWTIVLLDDDAPADDARRRSAALPLQLEPDRAAEIELQPLPRAQREVRETDRVDVRFHARDDFGVTSAELVFSLPDGSTHRSAVMRPPAPSRTWRHRHTWNISEIPISERSEVLYWVELRDNDPGLGLDPLPDPPGKVTRSATMRLVINDDEAEHAANIVKLTEIRDAAVDLLAARMTTAAFDIVSSENTRAVQVRSAEARSILHRASDLLAMLADVIDALSMDTLAHERDLATLTEIHRRLMQLHRKELAAHEDMPPQSERTDPDTVAKVLHALRPHNVQETEQLEDEVIRLDDLVDGQIIERLEALVARLEATQRKLVELLEQLKSGDESVRAQIEQLEQRRREDLRRIAEARAMLRKEVEQEFMNMDAFAVLERMSSHEQLGDMLRRGEIDEALEQARGQLGDVQSLRDQVQQRMGEVESEAGLTEEERQRMQLLRELSRLQDEQGNLQGRTRDLNQSWRSAVSGDQADETTRKKARAQAQTLRQRLEKINDARLGREARRGLEDARAALERLEDAAGREGAGRLELAETAGAATSGLRAAAEGAEEREGEGKAVRRALEKAASLEQTLRKGLPSPDAVLDDDARETLEDVRRRQDGLRQRASELMRGQLAEQLPPEGRKAMRSADRGMSDSVRELDGVSPGEAMRGQTRSWGGIQKAIDSLRRGSPPPPSGGGGEASTEAERDRSLRDALMDAMREGAPVGFDEPVKRYYEELLR
jgi:hypothetical protein